MNSVLSLMGNVTFAAATVASVFAVTTKLSASEPSHSPQPSVYAGDLWTSEPTVVDTKAQRFERIEAVNVAPQPVPALASAPANQVASLDPSVGITVESNEADPALTAQHDQWCAAHYRSFNRLNNTYRSFSGETRVCVSPFEASKRTEAASAVDQAVGADVEACKKRYHSYDVADNTYQPFEGGPRRVCSLVR